MATLFSIVVALLLLAGSSAGLLRVHQLVPKPAWLPAVLAIFFALPLIAAALKLQQGRSGFRAFVRTLFATSAGLLLLIVVHQRWPGSWAWACVAGVAAAAAVAIIETWPVMQAQMNVSQSLQELNAGKFGDALKHAQMALDVAVAKGERAICAEAEFLAGLCYNQQGESVRAARYLNRSRADFGPKAPPARIEQIDQVLAHLRFGGVDTAGAAAGAEDEGAPEGLAGQVAVNALLATAALLAAVKLLAIPSFRASTPVLVFLGVLVVLLVAGAYFTADLVLTRDRKRSVFSLLVIQSAGVLVAAAGVLGVLVRARTFAAVDFPASIQRFLGRALAVLAAMPSWVLVAAMVTGAIAAFVVLMLATGRSPLGVFAGIAQSGSSETAMRLARTHLDASEWSKAIVQLSRIDLVNEKNAARRAETLFLLAFAHHKADHPNEAREHINEMLEIQPESAEGLYLAGYLMLAANDLEAAEGHWRRLHAVAPGYRPADRAGRSATYYLCLTLYRKAMALVARDVEQASEALAEAGRLGAIDREAADALIRVHLYRFVELVRRSDWTRASQESELAQGKLHSLQASGTPEADTAKIRGFSLAAQALTALHRGQNGAAASHFEAALDATKSLRPSGSFGGSGGTLLEEMLRALMAGSSDSNTINAAFPRDCGYLGAVARLHELREERVRDAALKEALQKVQAPLNEALASSPDSPEILALLGLLWYHLGSDVDMQEKGIEALQRVRERVASKFVSQTLGEYENDQQLTKDARQAYFELLQQHLQSANVPMKQREALQAEVVERLRQRGQYEAFVGKGGLEVTAGEEPSVRDYVNRAHLLDIKVKQALQKRTAGLSPAVAELIDRLNAQNETLQQTVGSISELEMKILQEALGMM